MSEMREYLACHCCRRKDHQRELLNAVGIVMAWKACRCRQLQISQFSTIEEFKQAVMNFLTATRVGKFPPKCSCSMEQAQSLGLRSRAADNEVIPIVLSFPFCLSLTIHCSRGTMGIWGESLPSSRLARRWREYHCPSYPN